MRACERPVPHTATYNAGMKPILVALVALAVLPSAGVAQTDPPMLRVQGAAELRVAPDLATVRLGVVAEAPAAGPAQRQASDAIQAVFDALRGLGIDDRQVQTGRLTLSPVYTNSRPGEASTISGYRAANTVSVRLELIDQVGAVIDAALGAGANELQGVVFGLADDEPERREALQQAIAEARGKAAAMADALDVSLASILSVTEESVFVQRPTLEFSRAMALQAGASTPVAAGEVTVSASVSIVYRIE